ncbi:DUF6020 family protein [Butyrivibrio proteoclasticus]|uniref:DUF6020 family protein n=1 Tax=Butyrivibrio proteoclasticus TaxID=43305 RepID=UPI00047BBF3E|nr:DUF6020 family protein [Butyrivibrio proteoclasticus]
MRKSSTFWGKQFKEENVVLAWLMSGLFGVLSGIFLVFGYQLETHGSINLTDKNAILVMVCIMAIMTFDSRYVWRSYDNCGTSRDRHFAGRTLPKIFTETDRKADRREFYKLHLILIALNIPVLLAEFPGFFVYDAQDELNEVLTRTFTTHHPLLHVLLLGGTITLIHKISGSWNAGIFLYIVLQMLVITWIFAYVITFLKKRGVGKKYRIFWLLFYGLFPTIVMYTLCSSKDGLFSALLLLLTVFLVQLFEDPQEFLASKTRVAAFVATAVLMPCFRHNGFYAYLVFVPIAIAFLWKKKSIKLTTILAGPIVLYLVVNLALSSLFGATGTTHHQEILTVPIMQLARSYKYDRDSMSEEDIKTLTSYIPEENLNLYTDKVSDLVKVDFNNDLYEANSRDFWDLWFKMLKKSPGTYLNAWLLTCYGYFYPPASFDVYKGTSMFTFTYEDNCYFGYEVELPGERHSFIPIIDKFYRYISIGTFPKDAPIPALIFAPGLWLIVYLFVFCYRICRKKKNGVLPFLPMVLTCLTVMLGPTYLVRYVVILWFNLPLLMATSDAE